MIPLFLDPRPDELFYSVCARIQDAMRFDQKSSIGQYLFGNRQANPVIDLPSCLGHVVDALPPGHTYTVDRLINECTLLPFYAPFLPTDRVAPIRLVMGKDQPQRGGWLEMVPRQSFLSGSLRFCPLCVEEERTQFGTCYWHRLHQVSCVIVCPAHLVMVEESAVPKQNSRRFISAEEAIKIVPVPRILTVEAICTQAVRLAEDVAWLLRHPNLLIGPDTLALRYQLALRDQGFAVSTSNIDWRRFCRMFGTYYSEELLRLFPYRPDMKDIIQWLQRLVLRAKYPVNPTYHLLLMQFLGYSSETFFKRDLEQKLFRNGPWPCLNPLCEYFQRPVIQNVDVVMPWNGSTSIRGILSCSCGFVYVQDDQDQAKCDPLDGIKILFAGPKREQRFQRLREAHRATWLRVRRESPTATYKELYRITSPASIWLVKHDKDWLIAHQPKPIPSLENVVDWKQRDAEFAHCVKESAHYLLNRFGCPVRLTAYNILRRLNATASYHTYQQHMPLTTQVLEEVTETCEAYSIRKIWRVAIHHKHAQNIPSWDQLLREAVVPEDEVFPVVAGAINAALEMLCRTVSNTSENIDYPT